MPLLIGFRVKRSKTLFSTIVAVVAGEPTHVLIGNPETNEWWHADSPNGVSRVPYDPLTARAFEFFVAPPSISAAGALHWCRRQGAAGYDWFSVLFYWTPLTWRTRWTCSEFVASALAAGGEYSWVNDVAGTPRRLYRRMREHGYVSFRARE